MLAKRLGYASEDRLLIINADDFGMCHSTNRAIEALLTEGAITSTTIMMPCPWMKEAARIASRHPHYDVGIHLTLTSEWERYKWGPLSTNSSVPTLVDDFGHFPPETFPIREADPGDIRRECIAQIEAALKLGVDITHLDNHMASLQGGKGCGEAYFELLVELCVHYGLPLRLSRAAYDMIPYNEQAVQLADAQGVLFPDFLVDLPFVLPETRYEATKEAAMDLLRRLKPGVTECIFHPSMDSDELRGITSTWAFRNNEFRVFRDPDIQSLLRSEQITLIRWRDLRDLQRSRGVVHTGS